MATKAKPAKKPKQPLKPRKVRAVKSCPSRQKHDRATLVPAICARLATGEPLAVICRDVGVPWRTVDEWRQTDAAIAKQFDEARDLGYDAIAHGILAIADDGRNDWMERLSKDGSTLGWMVNGEAVSRSKLRIEARLKLLAKWDPRRYGDKVQLADANGDSLPAPQFIIQPVRPKGADE